MIAPSFEISICLTSLREKSLKFQGYCTFSLTIKENFSRFRLHISIFFIKIFVISDFYITTNWSSQDKVTENTLKMGLGENCRSRSF